MLNARTLFTRISAAIVAAALPLVAVAPAHATPIDFSVLTIDCDLYGPGDNSYINHARVDGTAVTVTLENCVGFDLREYLDSGLAELSGTAVDSVGTEVVTSNPETLVISGDVEVNFWIGDVEQFQLETLTPGDLPNPADSVRLDRSTAVIGESPSEFIVPGAPGDEVDLGTGSECTLTAGGHAYAEQKIIVSDAGTYTFRVVSTDPQTNWLHENAPYTPMQNTFLMLTGEFDNANPDNTVACDDDLGWETVNGQLINMVDVYVTADGDLYDWNQPYLAADLQPGNYTLVFTFWDPISSADWDAGSTEDGTWTPSDATFNFDVWGPEGGAELVDSFPALADTGVDPAFGLWSGLALAGTGVAITAARRRSQRA